MSVELSGVTCADFEEDVYLDGLDATLGAGDASFSETACADVETYPISGAVISTEVTVPLALISDDVESVHAHVIALIADDGGAALEANILSFARRRRLGMSDISVASVSVETFSPTPAPTPAPTTSRPSPRPSAVAGERGGGSDENLSTFIIIIIAVVAILAVALALAAFGNRRHAARIRQKEGKDDGAPAAHDEEGKAEQIEVRVRTPDREAGRPSSAHDSTLRF